MSRVVVTGIGIVSSVGIGKERFIHALKNGESGMKEMDFFAVPENRKIAATIPELPYSDPERCRIALEKAISEALDDAGITNENNENTAILMGTMAGDLRFAEERIYKNKNDGREYSLEEKKEAFIRHQMSSLIDGIAAEYGLGGTRMVASNACASSTIIMGYGYELIKNKKADIVVVCGVDMLKEVLFWGAEGLKFIGPELTPFDKNRNGTVLGEGAGVIVLESEEHAKKRYAHMYVEFSGYGIACDTDVDMIVPQGDGMGMVRAIRQAVENSGVNQDDIGYVNAHGTGTKNIDKVETAAIKHYFGNRSYQIPMSSTKSMIGHTSGAGGILEAAAAIFAITDGFYPPSINCREQDPELDLDYVTTGARKADINSSLSSNIGGGGVNAVLLFSKPGRKKEVEMKECNIVVTGIGCVSPFGNNVKEFSSNCGGQEQSEYTVSNFNSEGLSTEERFHLNNLAGQYVLAAAKEAYHDANLNYLDKSKIGVLIGTAYGGYTTTEQQLCKRLRENTPRLINPYLLLHSGHNLGASLIAKECNIEGMYSSITTGITSGLDAIAYAISLIKTGRMDAVIVGGVDILDDPIREGYSYFNDLRDIRLSEGAGVLIIESDVSAKARNAHIYGYVSDYRSNSDVAGKGKLDRTSLKQKQNIEQLLDGQDSCDIIYSHNYDCRNINRTDIPVRMSEKIFGEAHSAVSMFAAIQLLIDPNVHNGGIVCASSPGGANSAILFRKESKQVDL